MPKLRSQLIMILMITLMLFGCSISNGEANELTSGNDDDPYLKEVTPELIKITEVKNPPIPIITADNVNIEVKQGSYCWSNACADMVGPKEMLENETPQEVKSGTVVEISFPKIEQPTELMVTQIEGEDYTDIKLQNGEFILPDKKGTYYYMLSANWASPTEEHVSLGQTSVVYVIKVI